MNITDPTTASNIQNSLVDPRAIRAVLVYGSEAEDRFSGAGAPEEIAYDIWRSSNKSLFEVLSQLGLYPKLKIQYLPFEAGPELMEAVTGILTRAFKQAGGLSVALQPRIVAEYPAGVSGPRNLYFATFFETPTKEKASFLITNFEILPKNHADGIPTVEIRQESGGTVPPASLPLSPPQPKPVALSLVEIARKAGRPICDCTEPGEIMKGSAGSFHCPKCGRRATRKSGTSAAQWETKSHGKAWWEFWK